MGTRLYPITKKTEIIEQLAEVPAGTYAALEEFEANPENECTYGEYEDIEKNYEIHCRKTPGMQQLDGFILYGWNKFNGAALGVLKRWGLEREMGKTTNPIIVRALINSMEIDLKGVKLEELEGLVWY